MSLSKINQFIDIIAQLRNPNGGCPWDLEQRYDTMPPYILEEAYEVIDAIQQNDKAALKEELGDLLLQVVFLCQLAKEEGLFDFDEVVEAISTKIIRRHPHVFADAQAESRDEVLKNWEEIKQQERAQKQQYSILDNIPQAFTALMRAEKIQKRCAKVGFDWQDLPPVLDKVNEELDEIRELLAQPAPDKQRLQEEVGDLFFSAVNVARHLKCEAESSLRQANTKFEQRFRLLEKLVAEQTALTGKKFEDFTLAELDQY